MRSLLLCLTLSLMLTGCTLWPAQNAARANLKNVEALSLKYLRYVEKDGSLSSASKKIKKLFVDEAKNLAQKMVENSR